MKRVLFLLVTLVACGGTQEEEPKPATPGPGPAGPAKKVTSSDVAFEIAPVEIKGVVYEPDALGRPGMPLVEAKRATTIAKQCKLVQTTKEPVQKQAQAAILATMLYLESKSKADDKKPDEACNKLDESKGREKALLGEARQVLRDVAQQAGEKAIDEITLRMLGSYELLLDDYPAAEKAWASLIDKDPKSKELDYNRAWLVYAQLKQFKNADAVATLAGAKPDDKQPELAYVTAWAKIRSGDGAGAWQAISVAVQGWGENAPKPDDLEREVLWFAGRAGIAVDQAAQLIALRARVRVKQAQSPPDQQGPLQQRLQYEMLAKLGLSGYALAGRWADGVAALNKAVDLAGKTVPPNDLPVIRDSQLGFTVRLDTPDVAAKFAKQTVDAVDACADKCPAKDKTGTIQDVYQTGLLFHLLYATANDARYYGPSREVYKLILPEPPGSPNANLDAAHITDAQTNLKKLETTLRNTKVGTGTHDKGAIGALLGYHALEVQACYEAVLGSNRKLAGAIVLNLESDQTGVIKGLSLEPKPGAADLSAVTGCVGERAKQWKLPKRGMAGSTRIKLTYSLAPAPKT